MSRLSERALRAHVAKWSGKAYHGAFLQAAKDALAYRRALRKIERAVLALDYWHFHCREDRFQAWRTAADRTITRALAKGKT